MILNQKMTIPLSIDDSKLTATGLIRGLLLGLGVLLSGDLLAQADVSGVWMLNGRAQEGELRLTAEGLRIQSEYDLLEDDPSLYCVPASASRVWANPNVRTSIEQYPDRIFISHEFFDLRRDIPIGDASVIPDEPSTKNVNGSYFAELGSSFAYYQGDHLIIESRKHAPGYIRTSVGVPQGEETHTIEELWLEDGELRLTQTYIDETLFEVPFVLNYRFTRFADSEIPLYQCTDADYDWFNELNSPVEEDGQ